MRIFLPTKIHAQINPGTPQAIENTCIFALVTQTHMYKNSKKCKYSKKYFYRCSVFWSPSYLLADNGFMTMCVGIKLPQRHMLIFSKPATTGNLQYTGKKALITSNQQSTGKKVNALYMYKG